jgi:hypothetical protein
MAQHCQGTALNLDPVPCRYAKLFEIFDKFRLGQSAANTPADCRRIFSDASREDEGTQSPDKPSLSPILSACPESLLSFLGSISCGENSILEDPLFTVNMRNGSFSTPKTSTF